MKHFPVIIILVALAIIFNPLTSLSQEADAVLGIWLTQDKDSKVEIYKKNNKYHGKIVWLKEPNKNGKPKVDDKNPDEKKNGRAIMGLVLMTNFEYDEDFVWEDGEIYDPKNGKTYSCKMTLSKDKNTLDVRGFIGISLIGRTAVWTRSKLDD